MNRTRLVTLALLAVAAIIGFWPIDKYAPRVGPMTEVGGDYILVVFTDKDYCAACRKQAKTLEEIRKLPIRVYEFGLGEDRATQDYFKMKLMPTYLLWHKKKGELWRNNSAKETKKLLVKLLDRGDNGA